MTHAKPIHQSAATPILIMGMERPLAIALLTTAAALILGVGLHWYSLALAAFLLTAGVGALRMAARYDPQLSAVYLRHRTYQTIYPATGSLTPPALLAYKNVPARRDVSGWKIL
jgi:type IV secretory pathway TrbD component